MWQKILLIFSGISEFLINEAKMKERLFLNWLIEIYLMEVLGCIEVRVKTKFDWKYFGE